MKTIHSRSLLITCAAAAALSMAATAQAQAQTQPAPASTLEEVVVTAQKRAENLQDVPIAVTAVGGEQLAAQGVTNTQALSTVVPGLIVGHTSTSSSTYLRGVGQSTGTAGAEAAISTYIDGIYLAAPAMGLFDFANVDQVAVLRGPQGTLFGRNSTGGLIQVTTRNPSFTETKGEMEVGYGNLGTLSGNAYVSGPLASSVAGSLAFVGHRSSEGYIKNTYTGHDIGKETSYAAQGKLLWDIGPDTRATLNTFSTYYKGTDGIVAAVFPGTRGNDGTTIGTEDRVINGRIDPYQKSRSWIQSLKVEHDLGWGTVSNQLSNVDYYNFYHFNQNGTSGRPNLRNNPVSIFDNVSRIKNIADEFQIQSPSGQDLQWVVGGFYFHNKTKIDLRILSDDVLAQRIGSAVVTDSLAGFAQVTKTLMPKLRGTAGIRYTQDEHKYSGLNSLGQTPINQNAITSLKYSKPTWRLALDYDASDDLLVYASYNRGFKSGNFNNTSFTVPPFGPEVVDAYEVGFKSELMDRRVRLNSSVFYYDYKGIQLKANIPPSSVAFTYNAASSKIYGLDTDFAIVASSEWTINGGFEVLHAEYESLPAGIRFVANPVTAIPAGCAGGATNTLVGGVTSIPSCNLSGNDIVRAPKFSANLGVQYRKEMDWGRLTLNLSDAYMGGFYFEPDNNAIRQPAYHWVTASVKVEPGEGRYSIKAWVNNLTNSDVYGSGQSGANYTYFIGKPRMYGVTLGTSF